MEGATSLTLPSIALNVPMWSLRIAQSDKPNRFEIFSKGFPACAVVGTLASHLGDSGSIPVPGAYRWGFLRHKRLTVAHLRHEVTDMVLGTVEMFLKPCSTLPRVSTRELSKKHAQPLSAIINFLTKLLTRFNNSHIRKNVPRPGGHVFQQTETILNYHKAKIHATHVLTKFNKDWTTHITTRDLIMDRRKLPVCPATFRGLQRL
ncbi:hypothetical protein DPMN_160926 [Dreissena polymorpha]|uniref:Uncharacterized protein n=1 Tax=Dreissena polymorpha TaxID=45954 RepID=A0A9D4ES40_DREPO|nr:hypothetical protein DPMN_160926 [Dreissena polymorpha]